MNRIKDKRKLLHFLHSDTWKFSREGFFAKTLIFWLPGCCLLCLTNMVLVVGGGVEIWGKETSESFCVRVLPVFWSAATCRKILEGCTKTPLPACSSVPTNELAASEESICPLKIKYKGRKKYYPSAPAARYYDSGLRRAAAEEPVKLRVISMVRTVRLHSHTTRLCASIKFPSSRAPPPPAPAGTKCSIYQSYSACCSLRLFASAA